MTIEHKTLTDQQIAIALKIIGVVNTHPADDVMAAMVSIMSHSIGQTDNPEKHALLWADILLTTVMQTQANGDLPYNGGSIE